MDTEGNAVFEVPAESARRSRRGEKPLIAGVVFQSDTFMQTVQAGMQAAADKAGAEMIMGNTENKLDKEASMIDDYITRGVKAIVITPISADGSMAALKKAKDAGITIFCFNTCVNDPTIPSGVPGDQERRPGRQERCGGGEVHHREAGRQGEGRHPELRPVRRLPAAQGRLPGAAEGAAGGRGGGGPGGLAGGQGAAGVRGDAAGEPRHQRAVGGERRRHGGARQCGQDAGSGRQGVRLRHRHEQPDGPDAPGAGRHPAGCHRPGALPDGLRLAQRRAGRAGRQDGSSR